MSQLETNSPAFQIYKKTTIMSFCFGIAVSIYSICLYPFVKEKTLNSVEHMRKGAESSLIKSGLKHLFRGTDYLQKVAQQNVEWTCHSNKFHQVEVSAVHVL